MLAAHVDLARHLDELEQKYDKEFRVVFEAIRELAALPEKSPKQIGFRVRGRRAPYGLRRSG